MEAIRIISVDDHPVISDAIRAACETAPDLTYVAGFSSLDAVPGPFRSADLIDVVVLDLSLNGTRGIAAVEAVAAWGVKILVFSATAQALVARDALEHGAHGFVNKAMSTEHALDGVRAVWRGERPMLGVDAPPEAAKRLTQAQETLVRAMCAHGTQSAALATEMGVRPATIDNMVNDLYNELHLEGTQRNRAALVKWGNDHGYGE